jgi:predicted ATPase
MPEAFWSSSWGSSRGPSCARSVGEQFADGAYFVTLAPVSSDEHVAATIARQLDVVLLPSESADEALARHLADREVLLVLDNFEHVLGAAPRVADQIAATTRVKVLATSREPLRVRAEQLFRLDPLALPPVEANGDAAGVEQAPRGNARCRDACEPHLGVAGRAPLRCWLQLGDCSILLSVLTGRKLGFARAERIGRK